MFFKKIFGDTNKKYLKKIEYLAKRINDKELEFEKLSDFQLKEKTEEFKTRLKNGESLNEILIEAFALVREGAKRTLSQRHFNVQILGGIALHQGKIIEMKTGEGKTLVATLPAYLNALEGNGVHIITVNDYLAKRDTIWMGQIYYLLGLSVSCIVHNEAFLYDPLYLTEGQDTKAKIQNEELKKRELDKERDVSGGFKVFKEFLRPVSRKEAYQADITYGTNNEFGFDYLRDNMVYRLDGEVQRGFHYAIIDEVDSILIDEARTPLIISAPDIESGKLYEEFAKIVPYLKENIDFNIDEKARIVSLTEEGINKVERMMGKKGLYEKSETKLIYHLEQALKAQFLFKKDYDYIVKNNEVIIVDEFTGRLLPGRRFSLGLHQAIEAKEGVRIREESRTLATITFQNYFRMYQKLSGMTGTAITSAEEFEKVYKLETIAIPTHKLMIRKDLPDRIYTTEKAKFKAIIEEIKKCYKAGRPVLVGTTSIEKNERLSSLLQKEGIPHKILNAKHHEKEGEIIAQAGKFKSITVATNMAGRGVDILLGGHPSEETKNSSEWRKEHERIISLGGLYVMGTERHEARRIDNQLRGRSGRQGDPGSSQFFISLEDDLIRIFGGESLKRLLERFKFPEDLPIENKFISKIVESAQTKIEGYNFDIRRHLLEFDDVLNNQRDKIYKERKKILEMKDSFPYLETIFREEIEKIIDFHVSDDNKENWNLKEIFESIKTILPERTEAFEKIFSIAKKEESRSVLQREIKEYILGLFQQSLEGKKKEENSSYFVKIIMLQILDFLWMEHLENMEALRDSVRLRAYGQIDPLVAYRNEGYKLFKDLFSTFKKEVVFYYFKFKKEETKAKEIVSLEKKGKIGRNDPCPCGSGKKYKKCHGRRVLNSGS